MRKQLDTTQIDALFDFVRSKYVRYIDVQHELVDHLATAIEEEVADTDVSFETALNTVYGRFPITGFATFVSEKEKAMRRYWRLRQFAYLRTYFTLPKLIMALAIFMVSWTIFGLDITWLHGAFYGGALMWSLLSSASVTHRGHLSVPISSILLFIGGVVTAVVGMQYHMMMGIVGVVLMFLAVWLFKTRNTGFQETQKVKDRYLVYASFYGSIWTFGTSLLMGPLYAGDFRFISMGSDYLIARLLLAAVVTLSLVFSHACYTEFRYMLDKELEEKYPHLEIA
jgi:hypothetical protein